MPLRGFRRIRAIGDSGKARIYNRSCGILGQPKMVADVGLSMGQRVEARRKRVASNRSARRVIVLGGIDLLFTFIFAVMPDSRDSDSDSMQQVFIMQAIFAWFNLLFSGVLLGLALTIYAVPERQLTSERQGCATHAQFKPTSASTHVHTSDERWCVAGRALVHRRW